MNIELSKTKGVPIQEGMIGLFFEDINYASDGGLYAEMIENRSFEFVKAAGDWNDYYVEHHGEYGWSRYGDESDVRMQVVMGSPLSEENPHYLRVEALKAGSGIMNKAYDGIHLKKGMDYTICFFARCVKYSGNFIARIEKDGVTYGTIEVRKDIETDETYNHFCRYEGTLKAEEDITGAKFVLCMNETGVVEFDFISMFPVDAVAGIFRRDLFELLYELKPGFIRFPGGCIIEGNTLSNRYRYKDTLKEPWNRKSNWNRWAVHNNSKENQYVSQYAQYNQTYGIGYYEYFLLCEMIGAKAIPVLNVGLACQYQSKEMVAIDSPEFAAFLDDAIDLIEFANGDTDTEWGAIRAKMGHPEPFYLEMIGIGNEQWQTKEADFFERYEAFYDVIHTYDPNMKLIGSAGPDITSERYDQAWDFYRKNEEKENFVYAVDEHYYVPPKWLFEQVDFYDAYSRKTKVFSGEYAAHPESGMNLLSANNLEGALAEAAFLTGVERNADVVVLASYAPLFARVGYAQWSPDMIWFDDETSYGTPSYYVQQMYAHHMGDYTLDTKGMEKEAAKDGIYYSLSYMENEGKIIVKVVNANTVSRKLTFDIEEQWNAKGEYHAVILTGEDGKEYNSIEDVNKVKPYEVEGNLADGIVLEPLSFMVLAIS